MAYLSPVEPPSPFHRVSGAMTPRARPLVFDAIYTANAAMNSRNAIRNIMKRTP
jgi:hypothetical protein